MYKHVFVYRHTRIYHVWWVHISMQQWSALRLQSECTFGQNDAILRFGISRLMHLSVQSHLTNQNVESKNNAFRLVDSTKALVSEWIAVKNLSNGKPTHLYQKLKKLAFKWFWKISLFELSYMSCCWVLVLF